MPDPATSETCRRGLINPRIVRGTAFALITITLLVCTVLSILAIWDYMQQDALWRALATLAVVTVACFFFSAVNERLGGESPPDGEAGRHR